MEKKKWYHSKTLWANFIGIIIIIVSSITANEELVKVLLTIEASVLVIVNVILRAVTNQGLEK